MLTIHAPAKLNLVLEILGKPDDYHDISSVVHAISLCDTLTVERHPQLQLSCDQPDLVTNNLVLKAASALQQAAEHRGGASIQLLKRIPLGAGLGGGSSDAAAVLLALNELWQLGLSLSELAALASGLGSDVPFFLYKGTALIEGRGDRVTPLPPPPPAWFVVLPPAFPTPPNKTKRMYEHITPSHFTEGRFTLAAVSSLVRGQAISASGIFNTFDKVAFDFFPALKEAAAVLRQAGAPSVHVAGSGPTLFAMFTDRNTAAQVHDRLREHGLTPHLIPSLAPSNKD